MRRRRWLVFAAWAVLLYAWSTSRIPRMADYQTPPHPIMHGNYYTYHDMSEQWDLGKKPGVLDMTKNGQYNALGNPYLDYAKFQPAQQQHYLCDFYDLDIGFLFPVDVARRLYDRVLPDSYLRTMALQLLVDALATGAIFVAFIGWGWLPALGSAFLYASNISIATQVSLAFYYFWDATVALAALLLLTALFAKAQRRKFDATSVMLALSLGALLGLGIWLRSSWAAYSIVLVGLMLLNRKLWKYLPLTAIVLVACSSYPIIRASRLVGHPAVTTRQSWSAAFEALGKDPNVYGLENDDQYLFDVAREKYAAVDNNCQGTKRDAALKEEYLKIWRKDPAFIKRSIANRMYLGFFSNGARQDDQADRTALILALVGCGWMLLRGGSRRWLALSAAALFVVSTASVCLVYFVTGHYNGVSQVCLVLLAAGTFDLIGYLLPPTLRISRWRRRVFATGRLLRMRKWPVVSACIVVSVITLVLQQPRVQAYFAVPLFQVEWFAPAELAPVAVTHHVAEIRALPALEQRQLMAALELPAQADDEDLAGALKTRLKHIAGINIRDNVSRYELDLDASFAAAAQQALWHSEHFVLGFTVSEVRGFDPSERATWSGQLLRFSLKTSDPAALELMAPVLMEKFLHRGLQLVSRNGNTFVFRKSSEAHLPH
jgi:hypothetical protein